MLERTPFAQAGSVACATTATLIAWARTSGLSIGQDFAVVSMTVSFRAVVVQQECSVGIRPSPHSVAIFRQHSRSLDVRSAKGSRHAATAGVNVSTSPRHTPFRHHCIWLSLRLGPSADNVTPVTALGLHSAYRSTSSRTAPRTGRGRSRRIRPSSWAWVEAWRRPLAAVEEALAAAGQWC